MHGGLRPTARSPYDEDGTRAGPALWTAAPQTPLSLKPADHASAKSRIEATARLWTAAAVTPLSLKPGIGSPPANRKGPPGGNAEMRLTRNDDY